MRHWAIATRRALAIAYGLPPLAGCRVLGFPELGIVLRDLGVSAVACRGRERLQKNRVTEESIVGEIRIGLERRTLRTYGDRSLVLRARAKMHQHDRSGAFSLDRRPTTVRQVPDDINPQFRLGLSQPIRAAPLDFVSPRVRRNSECRSPDDPAGYSNE